MKKLLGVLILGLLWCNISFANDNRLEDFNQWLYDNGHYKFVEKVESEKCKSFDIGDTNWYYNNCDQPGYKNNLDIRFYKS